MEKVVGCELLVGGCGFGVQELGITCPQCKQAGLDKLEIRSIRAILKYLKFVLRVDTNQILGCVLGYREEKEKCCLRVETEVDKKNLG